MSILSIPQEANKQTILRTFISYLAVCVLLFLFLSTLFLFPQVRSTSADLQSQTDKTSAQTYASILHRYIEDREFALSDIAQSPYLHSAVLLAQGERADFRDFVTHASLLGEDPELTILDVNAEVLFSEGETEDFNWTLPLLEEKTKRILSLENSDSGPLFKLAIPIVYGKGTEGVLVARFSA